MNNIRLLKVLKNKSKRLLSRYPRIFCFMYKHLSPERNRNFVVDSNTEIVIEGFPRSANTYAVFAFRFAQEDSVCIAHHLHIGAQVLEGVRRRIPVLVLIRPPEEAVRSLCLRHKYATVEEALVIWLEFYLIVESVMEHLVIADFKVVTKDLGSVIKRVNNKFATNFDIYSNNIENEKKVFDLVAKLNDDGGEGGEIQTCTPSLVRKKIYQSTQIPKSSLLDQANSLYEKLISQ